MKSIATGNGCLNSIEHYWTMSNVFKFFNVKTIFNHGTDRTFINICKYVNSSITKIHEWLIEFWQRKFLVIWYYFLLSSFVPLSIAGLSIVESSLMNYSSTRLLFKNIDISLKHRKYNISQCTSRHKSKSEINYRFLVSRTADMDVRWKLDVPSGWR